MSTRAFFAIQDDAVKLARKITASVGDVKPEEIEPERLVELAEQLVDIAHRLAFHRTRNPLYLAELAALANIARLQEPDPR